MCQSAVKQAVIQNNSRIPFQPPGVSVRRETGGHSEQNVFKYGKDFVSVRRETGGHSEHEGNLCLRVHVSVRRETGGHSEQRCALA